ncbi:isoamylase early set domain-containing protein [bacterium]|nr:isoamylase early set domain-containing protein [bacterium]
MGLKKRILKNGSTCKVVFTIEKDICPGAGTVNLVGDFNEWNKTATPMKRMENGSFSVALNLNTGNEYQFRYLIDGETWENDWHADKYVPTIFGDVENSVVVV